MSSQQILGTTNITPRNASKVPETSLARILTRECIKHLNETVDQDYPTRIEESLHPYPRNTKIKRMTCVEGKYRYHRIILLLFFFFSLFLFSYLISYPPTTICL